MRLERFIWAKSAEVRALREADRRGLLPEASGVARPSFTAALRRGAHARGLAVIAEYKRASPSRGLICAEVSPEEAARAYAIAGASCISVLTEEKYFGGELAFVNRAASALDSSPLPLLRKDFIFSPLQVQATAATRASALLLIARMTPQVALLRALREQTEAAGMEAVVEVFYAEDLRIARASGARLIQVNARDLDTLRVDREACLRLARNYPPRDGECWIAASGMEQPEHLRAAAEAGFTAALIGTALMRGGRPATALSALLAAQTGGHFRSALSSGGVFHKAVQADKAPAQEAQPCC